MALVLLDLSAAFETIDHSTLLGCLQSWFGVCGSALSWFTSYLADRVQSVKIGSVLSNTCKLLATVWGSSGFCAGFVTFLTIYHTS